MQMGFYFDQTRCTGCQACVVACKDWYDIPVGEATRIKILYNEENKWRDVQVKYLTATCYQCLEPLCVDACKDGAMLKNEETGIIDVDAELCVGLEECNGRCLKACPYDAPQFGTGANPKMWKCDLCTDRLGQGQRAICEESCPTRAIEVAPLEELKAKFGDKEVIESRGRKLKDGEDFFYSTRTKPAVLVNPKQTNLVSSE